MFQKIKIFPNPKFLSGSIWMSTIHIYLTWCSCCGVCNLWISYSTLICTTITTSLKKSTVTGSLSRYHRWLKEKWNFSQLFVKLVLHCSIKHSTLFTIRISISPDPSTGIGDTVPLQVPIGAHTQVCCRDGDVYDGCVADVITWNGFNIGNGVKNGNPVRETKTR